MPLASLCLAIQDQNNFQLIVLNHASISVEVLRYKTKELTGAFNC